MNMATEIQHEIDGKDYRENLLDKAENEVSPQEQMARDVYEILRWVRFLGWVTIIGLVFWILSLVTVSQYVATA